MKIIIVVMLLAIIAALGSSLVFMLKDQANSGRMVNALTLRVGLSVSLILILLLSYHMGWIQPHGVRP